MKGLELFKFYSQRGQLTCAFIKYVKGYVIERQMCWMRAHSLQGMFRILNTVGLRVYNQVLIQRYDLHKERICISQAINIPRFSS